MNESLLDDFRVQCEWISKLHSRDELRRRFVERTFEETFEAVGRKLDPALDRTQAIWAGYLLLCESKRLPEKYVWFFVD